MFTINFVTLEFIKLLTVNGTCFIGKIENFKRRYKNQGLLTFPKIRSQREQMMPTMYYTGTNPLMQLMIMAYS